LHQISNYSFKLLLCLGTSHKKLDSQPICYSKITQLSKQNSLIISQKKLLKIKLARREISLAKGDYCFISFGLKKNYLFKYYKVLPALIQSIYFENERITIKVVDMI